MTNKLIINADYTLVDTIYNQQSNANELAVNLRGHLCPDNTSNTLLLANVTFPGGWQDTLDYGAITIGIKVDQDSATDGLIMQWSQDAATVHDFDSFSIFANIGKVFTFSPSHRYFKVSYTNGSVDQGIFVLSTILRRVFIKASSHKINNSIVGEDDASLHKSVLTGEDPNGIFRNANVTEDGNLTISDSSSGLAIAEGNVTGKSFIHKFGNAPDFDTGDGIVTVWDGADDGGIDQMSYIYSTSAIIDSLSSSSNSDTFDVQVLGLDTDYNMVTKTITLTGQTRVALDTNLIRVFRMENNNSADNIGYIYCFENTTLSSGVPIDSTKVRAVIQPGNNQTLMAIYTVPAAKTAYMRDYYGAIAGANKTSNYIVQLRARLFGGVFKLKHIISLSDSGTSYLQHKFTEPEPFVEKTDIEIRVSLTGVGVSAASFSAGFDIVLVDN